MKYHVKTNWLQRDAFTMIEMVIVIGVMSVISLIGVSTVSRVGMSKTLDQEANRIVSIIRESQRKAVGEQEGSAWGIRFNNPSTGDDVYTQFVGDGFAGGFMRYKHKLDRSVKFVTPVSNDTVDVVFTKAQGLIGQARVIELALTSGEGSYRIVVHPTGRIEKIRNGQGLVGYWKFDEPDGAPGVLDASGNGRNGTATGVTLGQAGKVGRAVSFVGSCNKYISVPRVGMNFTSDDYTIMMWAKQNTTISNARVFSTGPYQNYGYEMFVDDRIEARTNQSGAAQSSLSTASQLGLSTWYHVAIVRDGSSIRTYVDGSDETVSAGNHVDPASSATDVYIGRYAGSTSSYCFDGWLDDVRVYNRALSANEVRSIYNDAK